MNTLIAQQGTANAAGLRRIQSVKGEPLFYADWLRTVFIHYKVDPEILQRAVPFTLDLLDGRAYLSVVAFTMRGMRPRLGGKFGALLFKPIATHGFLNVRAYVRHLGEPGIYFLAEWLSNPLSVQLGSPLFGLPYCLGRLNYEHEHERGFLRGTVIDRKNGARLAYDGAIEPATGFRLCEAGSLEEFLMERYTAFTQYGSHRRFFRIWHPPWPQTPVDIRMTDTSLLNCAWPWFKDARFVGANYSPGAVDVWMGRPQIIAL